jgi:hypothetical protein
MILGPLAAIAVTLFTVPLHGHPHPPTPLLACTEHFDGRPAECAEIPNGTMPAPGDTP